MEFITEKRRLLSRGRLVNGKGVEYYLFTKNKDKFINLMEAMNFDFKSLSSAVGILPYNFITSMFLAYTSFQAWTTFSFILHRH